MNYLNLEILKYLILTREVAYVKTPDGRETFKITVKASGLGG
jgi:hypothetical protein